MAGFVYRMAVRIKEFGERRHIGGLVRLGLFLREKVTRLPVSCFL